MAQPEARVFFLLPIKGHVDRLRLLVCAPVTHLGKMMSTGEQWRRVVVLGVSERERLIEEEKERKNMHMNPEGLMCLHYLGCDLSPTSSTSIMHHIHKHGTDPGAPATHSYYFNWIKSVQISRTLLPQCGFSILAVIWFVHGITLPCVQEYTSYTSEQFWYGIINILTLYFTLARNSKVRNLSFLYIT